MLIDVVMFERVVITLKIVNILCPEGLQNKFKEKSALSSYNTRNMRNLYVQKLKLEHKNMVFANS